MDKTICCPIIIDEMPMMARFSNSDGDSDYDDMPALQPNLDSDGDSDYDDMPALEPNLDRDLDRYEQTVKLGSAAPA